MKRYKETKSVKWYTYPYTSFSHQLFPHLWLANDLPIIYLLYSSLHFPLAIYHLVPSWPASRFGSVLFPYTNPSLLAVFSILHPVCKWARKILSSLLLPSSLSSSSLLLKFPSHVFHLFFIPVFPFWLYFSTSYLSIDIYACYVLRPDLYPLWMCSLIIIMITLDLPSTRYQNVPIIVVPGRFISAASIGLKIKSKISN